jgi:hypothetical protein
MPQLSLRSVALSDVISRGTVIHPHEAVTIVQQVCRYLAWRASLGETIGVPPLEEIRIDAAGEAAITDLKTAAAPLLVRDLARLLEQLLPAAGKGQRRAVPGPLRFIIARALGDVDARPFATAAEFSAALARFERDAPRQAIGALFDRWRTEHGVPEAPSVLIEGAWAVDAQGFRERRGNDVPAPARPGPAPHLDRRRHAPTADAFRAMLRESDQRAFESTGATAADPSRPIATPARDRRAHTPDVATFRRMLRDVDRAMFEHRAIVQPDVPTAPAATASIAEAPLEFPTEAPADAAEISTVPAMHAFDSEGATRVRSHLRLLAAAAVLLIALAIPVGWRVAHPSDHTTREKLGVSVPQSAAAPSSPSKATSSVAAATVPPPAPTVPTDKPASEPPPSRGDAKPHTAASKPTPVSTTPGNGADLVLASNAGDPSPFSPSFASNGSAMFFHEGREGGALMRADTGADGAVLKITTIVNDGSSNYHPRLSPDGEWIAFDSDRDGTRGVYIATREGKDVRRVTGEGYAAVPSWSPDGRKLAFVRAEPGKPKVWNLWLHDLDTHTETRLTNYSYGQPWGGSWFSDGRRICYSHEDAIYVLDLESGRTKRYPSPVRGRLARTPAVSPDGRRIVFQVYRDGGWLLDLADGSMRRILADPTAEEFTWSPDGRRVAFHSERVGGWALWMLGM